MHIKKSPQRQQNMQARRFIWWLISFWNFLLSVVFVWNWYCEQCWPLQAELSPSTKCIACFHQWNHVIYMLHIRTNNLPFSQFLVLASFSMKEDAVIICSLFVKYFCFFQNETAAALSRNSFSLFVCYMFPWYDKMASILLVA